MVRALKLKYVGMKRKQQLDMIPLDFDNALEFQSIYNHCDNIKLDILNIKDFIKEYDGYIIYDKVSVGVILLSGHKIEKIVILPEFKGKGYERKALYKVIELLKSNISLVVSTSEKEDVKLYLNNGFMIEKELE